MRPTGPDDPWNLSRFVDAQDSGGTYAKALRELGDGRKRGHWMWFVFPQITGLGRSATSRHFAIRGRREAEAYLAHPVLGPRLLECAATLYGLSGSDPVSVLGGIDAQKLQSSLTLFAAVAPEQPVFQLVLEKYFAGRADHTTLALLG